MFEAELGYADSLFTPLVGADYAGIMTAGLIIIAFFIAAKLVSFVFKRIISRLTSKTETDLDDLIMGAISLPLIVGIGIIGVFVALQRMSLAPEQATLVNLGFSVFYILFGAMVAIRVINALLLWYAKSQADKTKSKLDDHFLPAIRRVVILVVLLFALTAILGVFGVELTAIIATFGVGGIAIAIALQDTLKEFFAGGHVILDRPIKIGDFIELESGDRGTVVDIGWRSTTIRTFTKNYVVLPNSQIASSKLINYDQPKQEIGFSVPLGVSYHEDLEKVEKVTLNEAKKVLDRTGKSAKDFEPVLRFTAFGDSNIDLKVVFRVRKFADQYLVRHEFIKAIKKRYDKEGIEISWPVRKVYEHKGKGK